MCRFHKLICLTVAALAFLCSPSCSSEIEEFEILNNENNPVRKEFDNHTETCFKLFKSSMLKLTVLFLDPTSESHDAQQESKCWVKCMMERFKFINVATQNGSNGNGEIVSSRIVEKASDLSPGTRTKLSQIVTQCENYARGIDDICKKAFGFARCVFESYRGGSLIPAVPMVPFKPQVLVNG